MKLSLRLDVEPIAPGAWPVIQTVTRTLLASAGSADETETED